MPTVLSDPSPTLYVILAAVVVVLGAIALRRQKRSDVINFAIPAVVLLALYLIDMAVESPREQIVKNIQEMETATQNKKHADVFKHVSDSFKYKSLDKKGLEEKAQLVEALPNWEGIKVIGLDRKGFAPKDATTAEHRFEVQPLRMPGTEYRYDCIVTFKKEGEQWRVVGLRFEKDGKEVTPPGL
jgi:hypothetical protein